MTDFLDQNRRLYVSLFFSIFLFFGVCAAAVVGWYLAIILIVVFMPIIILDKSSSIAVFFWVLSLGYGNLASSLLIFDLSSLSSSFLRGLDFISLSLLFLNVYFRKGVFRSLYFWSVTVLILYFSIGLVRSGFDAAFIYLRLFLSLIFLSYVYFVLKDLRYKRLFDYIGYMLVFFVGFNFIFYIFVYDFIDFFNVDEYISRKYGGVMYAESFFYTKLFNSNYFSGIEDLRFFGFTLHPISSAFFYAGLFFWFFMDINKNGLSLILAIIAFFLTVVTYSKGALVLIISVVLFWELKRLVFPSDKLVKYLVVYIICQIVVFFLYGLSFGDPHVYSLVGSVLSFLTNPIGSGIGVGGSMFGAQIEALDFSLVRGDSGLAILLKMTGVAGIYIFWSIVRKMFIDFTDYRQNVVWAFILVAAIFQEEPMNPYSLSAIFLVLIKVALNKQQSGFRN
tara:strand:- start:4108 stop:5457 length:1350 start_codon:yes stop_codon:yes gene_type:complete